MVAKATSRWSTSQTSYLKTTTFQEIVKRLWCYWQIWYLNSERYSYCTESYCMDNYCNYACICFLICRNIKCSFRCSFHSFEVAFVVRTIHMYGHLYTTLQERHEGTIVSTVIVWTCKLCLVLKFRRSVDARFVQMTLVIRLLLQRFLPVDGFWVFSERLIVIRMWYEHNFC